MMLGRLGRGRVKLDFKIGQMYFFEGKWVGLDPVNFPRKDGELWEIGMFDSMHDRSYKD